MNLIGRVLLIAVCVFTAYAWPSLDSAGISKDTNMMKAVLAQLHTALNPIQALAVNGTNNTQDQCFTSYYAHQELINQQTANDTQDCYTKANNAMIAYNANVNQTEAAVRALSLTLQGRLSNCSAYNTTEAIFNCYVNTFDLNMQTLFDLTSQSQVALASMSSGFESQIEAERQACVANVVLINKSNSTTASNGLQTCLFSTDSSTGSNNNNSSNNTNTTTPGTNTTDPGTNSTTPGNNTRVYYLN